MELSKESKTAINGTSLSKALDVAMIVVHLEDTAVLWIDHRWVGLVKSRLLTRTQSSYIGLGCERRFRNTSRSGAETMDL